VQQEGGGGGGPDEAKKIKLGEIPKVAPEDPKGQGKLTVGRQKERKVGESRAPASSAIKQKNSKSTQSANRKKGEPLKHAGETPGLAERRTDGKNAASPGPNKGKGMRREGRRKSRA